MDVSLSPCELWKLTNYQNYDIVVEIQIMSNGDDDVNCKIIQFYAASAESQKSTKCHQRA